ncbi:protein SRG1-like [Trifolium pratense]|uniref:Protein SRG1-like n=2 Tax=Trifolium pratense TaxID=57577 RepID=A0A2K3LI28_TRIPR|nr:protein SRG1-like [Trifolium pratense]
MARSLNLEEGSFLDQFGKQSLLQARVNFYPRCSRPDLVLGVKPHTDRSGITTLLQDKEVEGLQVLIDDKWVNVPTIPDALVVNLGDQMQVSSPPYTAALKTCLRHTSILLHRTLSPELTNCVSFRAFDNLDTS